MERLLVLGFALAACGGDDNGQVDAHVFNDAAALTNVVTGSLGGNSFGALDAVSNTASASGFDFNAMSTVVVMTTFANECTTQTTHTGVPNGHLLVLVLASTDAAGNSSPISATGSYTVFSGTPAASSKLLEAYYEIDDGSCLRSSSEFATSGTVTVVSATDPQQATFDLTFPDGHVTGSFHAAHCAALNPNATPTC